MHIFEAEDGIMYESKMKSDETDHLFEAIMSLKSVEECYRFFDDLCTYGAEGYRAVLDKMHGKEAVTE